MPKSREKVSKRAHFFSESWPWLYLSIRDKHPSLPQWPLVFRSHQNSAHSGHGGDVTDLNSINFHLAPFSLSRHLTLSLLFQLCLASLFSGSLLWVYIRLSKTANQDSQVWLGANGLGVSDGALLVSKDLSVTSCCRGGDHIISRVTFPHFFFSTSLFTFVHIGVFYLSYIFLSYSLEKKRLLILNDSLLEII